MKQDLVLLTLRMVYGGHMCVLCGVNGPHHPKYRIVGARVLIKLTYAKILLVYPRVVYAYLTITVAINQPRLL